MNKNSFKHYVLALTITLSLASFAAAGEGHCPDDPPPPPSNGGRIAMQVTTDDSTIDQMIKGFWEFLGSDIF